MVLKLLKKFIDIYKPKKYLFEGQNKTTLYSIRSLESIIQAAKTKAGITNLKTTFRYLHVTNKDTLYILSPLEDIKGFL